LRAVLGYLVRERAIFAPHAGLCLFGLGPVRDARLGPAALMRGFGLNAQEAGLRLGIVAILAGGGALLPVAGCSTGSRGWAARTLSGRHRRGLGSALASVALALAGSPTGALVALTGLQFFSSFAITPSSALTQMVAPAMRAHRGAADLWHGVCRGGSGPIADRPAQ
jgi:hypothetical protein